MSGELLDRLDGVLDELAALSWDCLSDSDVVEMLRRLETAKRRFAPLDHALINQVEQRSLAFDLGVRTTPKVLQNLLRVSGPEAGARVRAAHDLGSRRTVTGQLVDPKYPHVAAAQSRGEISDRHAAVIAAAVEKLPDDLVDRCADFVEKTLTEEAHEFDPTLLAKHATILLYALDQDGQLENEKQRHKERSFDIRKNPDGSSRISGNADAELTAHLLAMLDAMTQPKSTNAGPDPRTATQRRHDAVLDWLKLVERAQLLPPCHGVTTTVVLTMDADAWMTGEGTARTGHGYTIHASTAKRWAGGDCRLMLTLLTKTKAVEAYSSTHRIFTEGTAPRDAGQGQGLHVPRLRRHPPVAPSPPHHGVGSRRRNLPHQWWTGVLR